MFKQLQTSYVKSPEVLLFISQIKRTGTEQSDNDCKVCFVFSTEGTSTTAIFCNSVEHVEGGDVP